VDLMNCDHGSEMIRAFTVGLMRSFSGPEKITIVLKV